MVSIAATGSFCLPPGPGRSSLRRTVKALLHPTDYFEDCQRRYGDFFTIRTPLERTIVFTSDPETVRQVFRGDPAVYHAGEGNAVLGPLLGSGSVLLADGASHLRQRRLLLPPFHGERMKGYRAIMDQASEREIAHWPEGREFATLPSMQAITLEVIMRAVFGVEDQAASEQLRARLRRLLDALGNRPRLLLLAITSSAWGTWSPWGRFRAAIRAVDELLAEQIKTRRRDPNLRERQDVLSMLLLARDEDGSALSDKELRDQLKTLLVAGHETTATALAWTVERLVHEPVVLAKAQQAASAGDQDYLTAVAKETLRLRPVVPAVSRRLTEAVDAGPWRLPAGVHLNPSIYLLHRRPDIYPDPEAFRPERFLDQPPANHEWIPFGGGVRRCLGASFALFEMHVVLEAILRHWRLRPAAGPSEEFARRAITFTPARGGRIAVDRL